MGAIGAVLGVVGGVMQGVAGMQAHEAEAQAHEYNAAVAVRNKEIIRQQGEAARNEQAIANWREEQSIRGQIAYTGLTFTGSSTDYFLDLIKGNQQSLQIIDYKTQLAMLEQDDKFNTEKMGASSEKSAGQWSLVSGILSGAKSGLDYATSRVT